MVILSRLPIFLLFFVAGSCSRERASHKEMKALLERARIEYDQFDNYYASSAQVNHFDSLIHSTFSEQDKILYTYSKARALTALGKEEEAIDLLESLVRKIDREGIHGLGKVKVLLGLAYLRAGERMNCVMNHSAETCILPIQGSGIHK